MKRRNRKWKRLLDADLIYMGNRFFLIAFRARLLASRTPSLRAWPPHAVA